MKAFTPTTSVEKFLKVITPIAINGGVGWDVLNFHIRQLTEGPSGGVRIEFKDITKNQDQPIRVLHPAIYEYLDGESDRFGKKEFLSKAQLQQIKENASQWMHTPVHSSRYAANLVKISVTVPNEKTVTWIGTISAATVEDLFNWIYLAVNGSTGSERHVREYWKVVHRKTKKMHAMEALKAELEAIASSVVSVFSPFVEYIRRASWSISEAVAGLYEIHRPECQYAMNEFGC